LGQSEPVRIPMELQRLEYAKMATIVELISGIEVELEAAQKRAQRAKAEIKLILDTAAQEGRASLSEQEEDRTKELFAAIDLSKAQATGIRGKLENARKVQAEEEESERKSQQSMEHAPAPKATRGGEQRWHVTNEPRTYSRESDRTGRQFLTDVCRQFMYNDVGASSRLARHMEEERVERGVYQERSSVGVGTGAFTGLTVPQYLTDMVAPAVANLRPFADVCNKHPLPADGMSVNISRITTPSTAALQASELAAVSFTDMDDTLLTVNVQTAAGEQLVSRQAIDRGNGIEDVVLQDLYARYNTALDNTLLSQASTGLNAVANGTAYTDASPTAAELYPFIMGAASQVESAMLAMGQPTHVLMHSRRWYWLSSQVSATWPFINSQGMPVQAGGTNTNATYNAGTRGVLPNGLEVIVDNNITTAGLAGALTGGTQDIIYVVPQRECHLWEEGNAPTFIRAEQPSAANLGVVLVVYGYFAYTFQRYALGMQKIFDTGLTAPAGF